MSKTDATTPADPMAAKLAELDALIEEQKARMAAQTPAPAAGLTGEDLKAILSATKAEQDQTRSVRHSNADHTHVSAFSHPEGDLKAPKATFTRETYFNNHREREDECTPAEIDAFNAITQDCSARQGTWKARLDRGRLLVEVPSYTMDDRMNLPDGLVLILRELANGTKAVTPADMAVRIAELERQVKSMGSVVLA